jgi:hypothetical protein
MYALQIIVTYIFLTGLPIASIWLSFREGRNFYLTGFYVGLISSAFALLGIVDILRVIIGGKEIGMGSGLVLFGFFGVFTAASIWGSRRNFKLAFRV